MASYLRDLGKLCKKRGGKSCFGLWGGGLCSNIGGMPTAQVEEGWGECHLNGIYGIMAWYDLNKDMEAWGQWRIKAACRVMDNGGILFGKTQSWFGYCAVGSYIHGVDFPLPTYFSC